MEKSYYVYVLFRPWDGSPCYVGKGKNQRWLDHEKRSCNRHLRHIIAKASGAELPKVKVRENLTESEAFEIEQAFIAAIGRGKCGPLVNLTDGGEGYAGRQHSQKTKNKIRDHHLIHFNDPIMREKISKGTRAAMATASVKKNTSAGQKNRYASAGEREKAARRATGRTHSTATKAKMSESHIGHGFSAETRLKLSAWQIGRKLSLETRARMSAAAQARHAQSKGA